MIAFIFSIFILVAIGLFAIGGELHFLKARVRDLEEFERRTLKRNAQPKPEEPKTNPGLMAEFQKLATKYSYDPMNNGLVQAFLIANYDDLQRIERERIHSFLKARNADISIPTHDPDPISEGSYRGEVKP